MKGFKKRERPKEKKDTVTTYTIPRVTPEEDINTDLNKKQLISKALSFHSQGKIKVAEKYYKIIIDKGFKDPVIFSNLGAIYKQKGQNDRGKAITHYSQTFSLPEIPGVRTVYNGDYLSIPAEEGQILIWRSHIRHGYINTNEGDNRTTLSFNSIPQTLRSGAYSFTVNDN